MLLTGIEPTDDSFHIVCSDGMNSDDQGLRFSIKIMAVNDEVPKIYINDFVVEEGKLLQIDLPILNVIDRDLPPDLLVFKVVENGNSCLILYISWIPVLISAH